MKKAYQKDKSLLKLNYLRQKNYRDPYNKARACSKNYYKQLRNFKIFFKKSINRYPAFDQVDLPRLLTESYFDHIRLGQYLTRKTPGTRIARMSRCPDWFKNVCLEFLLSLYENWDKQLQALNREYELKLWIFEKDFFSSDLVFGIPNHGEHFITHDHAREIDFLTIERRLKLAKYDVRYCKEMDYFSKEDIQDLDYTCSEFERRLVSMFGYDIKRTFLDNDKLLIDNLDYYIDLGVIEVYPTSKKTLYGYQTDNVWEIKLAR